MTLWANEDASIFKPDGGEMLLHGLCSAQQIGRQWPPTLARLLVQLNITPLQPVSRIQIPPKTVVFVLERGITLVKFDFIEF